MREPYLRYLRLLGLQTPPAGLDGLQEIVWRHVSRVPFENVSKLLLLAREGEARLTRISEFLDGIEQRDLGGTCYTSNPFLGRLLRATGYDADLLAADMRSPNIHTCIHVHLGGVDYHVDAGYGGPFRRAMRLDRLPCEIRQGNHRYVLDSCGGGNYEMAVYSGNQRVHGYRVHGPPRTIRFFRRTILDSFAPGSTFTSCLRIVRIFEKHTVELLNRTVTECRGSQITQTVLKSMAELRAAVNDQFLMPRCPVEAGVGILEKLTGRNFFGGDFPASHIHM